MYGATGILQTPYTFLIIFFPFFLPFTRSPSSHSLPRSSPFLSLNHLPYSYLLPFSFDPPIQLTPPSSLFSFPSTLFLLSSLFSSSYDPSHALTPPGLSSPLLLSSSFFISLFFPSTPHLSRAHALNPPRRSPFP